MLLLLGLMGVFAVGATALVWYEISSRSSGDDPEEVQADAMPPAPQSDKTSETVAPGPQEDADHIDELLAAAEDIAGAPLGTTEPEKETDQVNATPPNTVETTAKTALADGEGAAPVEETPPASDHADGLVADGDDAEAQWTVPPAPEPSVPHKEQSENAFSAAHQETVSGFLPDQDRLVIVFDDLADAFPVVGLVFEGEEQERAHITLNGDRITTVAEARGLTLDHITLVPESSLGGRLAA